MERAKVSMENRSGGPLTSNGYNSDYSALTIGRLIMLICMIDYFLRIKVVLVVFRTFIQQKVLVINLTSSCLCSMCPSGPCVLAQGSGPTSRERTLMHSHNLD